MNLGMMKISTRNLFNLFSWRTLRLFSRLLFWRAYELDYVCFWDLVCLGFFKKQKEIERIEIILRESFSLWILNRNVIWSSIKTKFASMRSSQEVLHIYRSWSPFYSVFGNILPNTTLGLLTFRRWFWCCRSFSCTQRRLVLPIIIIGDSRSFLD